MNTKLLLASSALALVLTGTATFAGSSEKVATPAPAAAATSTGFYVGLSGAYVLPTGKYSSEFTPDNGGSDTHKHDFTDAAKSAYGFGGAVGYRFGDMPVRVEVGFDYNIFNLSDKDVGKTLDNFNGYSIMTRAFYDFKMNNIVPYVGVGIGYDSFTVKLKEKQPGVDYDQAGFGYEGIIGADYFINDSMSIGANFTYHGTTAETKEFKTTQNSIPGKEKLSYSGVSFLRFGLRFNYFF